MASYKDADNSLENRVYVVSHNQCGSIRLESGSDFSVTVNDGLTIIPKGANITRFTTDSSNHASIIALYVDTTKLDIDNAYCFYHYSSYPVNSTQEIIAPTDGVVVMTGNGNYTCGVTNTDLKISTSTEYGGAMEVFAGDSIRVNTSGGPRGGFFIPYK